MQTRRRYQRKEHNYHLVHMPHSGLRGDYYQTGGDYIIWQKMLFFIVIRSYHLTRQLLVPCPVTFAAIIL